MTCQELGATRPATGKENQLISRNPKQGATKAAPKRRCHIKAATWRKVAWVGVALTSVLIGLITLTPQSSTSPHGVVSRAILNALHSIGVPESFGPVQWEFTANIIMFTPLGFFLALTLAGSFPRPKAQDPNQKLDARTWAYLAVFPLATGFIETTQFLFLPSRYATWSDFIANSLGGFIGYGVGLLVLLAVARWGHRARAN